ncbi:tyrosine-type recombinase/integrase [Clostridium neuense]|uniref:Tyrosine-type recombinase/integrase n=1 Tax=Clostridium neuense TaxID=1728934 RepID=A0ABW8TFH8_9CLOT
MTKNFNITIKHSIDIFIKSLQVEGKAKQTIVSYTTDIKIFYKFIQQELSNKIRYVSDIGYFHLELFKEYLNKNYCFSSTCRKYNCLRTYLRIMHRFDYINEDIIKKLNTDKFGNQRREKKLKVSEIRNGVISQEVRNLILQRVENDKSKNKYRDIALIHILNHGLRRSEVLYLKWSDFNFSNKTMNIWRPKNCNFDTVRISDNAVKALEQHFRISSFSNSLNDKVFSISTTPYNKIINKYTYGLLSETGKRITGHSFRHTFITTMIRKNVSLSKIQRYVGISLEVLEQYTHLNFNDTDEIANLI